MPRAWTIPVAVFAVAAAAYALLGSLQDLPLVAPDEFLYAQLSRSVADGDGLALYGTSINLRTAIYVYLIAPSWLLGSTETGYTAAKVVGAIVACVAVFPVWVLTRRLTSVGSAVVAVVLTLAGSWMVATAGLLTENLAFPLSTAALSAGVLALRDPGSRWQWAALGFAVLATGARAQMGVLFAILLCALLLDSLRADSPRAHLQAHRVHIAVLGAIVLAGLMIVLSGSTTGLGPYAEIADFRPSLADILGAIGQQWIALVTMSAFLPVAAMLTLAAQKPLWRDRDIAPLLCVSVPAVVLLVIESGYFLAGPKGISWSIERYVMYAVPLLIVLAVVAIYQRRLPLRDLAIACGVVVVPLLATPGIRLALEEGAQFGTWTHLDDAIGLGTGPALALVGALVTGIGLLIVARARPARAVLGTGALLFAVFLIQSQAIWNWHFDYTDKLRSQFPSSLTWVDDNARGAVSRVYLFANSPLFQTADFFNEDIDQVLVPGADVSRPKAPGRVCLWNADPRGVLVASPGCRIQRTLWNDDPLAVLSFHGGKTLARDPALGQVLAVPQDPRLRSIVRMPCQRLTLRGGLDGSSPTIPTDGPCSPSMAVDLWVDAPGTLELTFQGGERPQTVRYGSRTWNIAPARRTTVRVPVNRAQATIGFETDWTRSAGSPRVVEAAFVTDAGRTPLL